MSERLYVSGPMSGIVDHNFPAFRAAANRLRIAGFEVENPADKGLVDGWNWADYLRYDIRKMMDCDGVALLSGWEGSRGARLEVHVARALGMDCRPVDAWIKFGVTP